jgi:hypothetical protein
VTNVVVKTVRLNDCVLSWNEQHTDRDGRAEGDREL